MTKQEKFEFVEKLADEFRSKPNFYIVDMGGMSVEQSNNFRRKLFEKNLSVHMAKNTLIRKALEKVASEEGRDYTGIYSALKTPSSLIFVNESANEPAKLIKSFAASTNKPGVKGAYVEEAAFVGGANLLDTLATLKGRKELLGDIIGLLQSPAQNLVSALQSGQHTLGGLVKALEERKA